MVACERPLIHGVTRRFLETQPALPVNAKNRQRRNEQNVWQRRFFEHTCRDDADVKRCVDYVHVNPLKHGLVEHVRDWPWSSFHRYVSLGEYDLNWGSKDMSFGDEFSDVEL